MLSKTANIIFSIHNDNLCIKCDTKDDLSWQEIPIADWDKRNEGNQLLMYWILNTIKPVFFSMPYEKIEVKYSKDALDRFNQLISFCMAALQNTNAFIVEKLKAPVEQTVGNQGILFYGVDEEQLEKDTRYGGLHARLKTKQDQSKLYYLNMASGFNAVLRRWEDNDVPMPIEELIAYLYKNSIYKIFSTNHYLLEKYLFKKQINLLSVFYVMNIEYVILDNDPKDQSPEGYLAKQFFNHTDFCRFSFDMFNQYWDEKYGMTNVKYVTVPQEYGDKKFAQLNEDYGIVVLSHSRADAVKSMLTPILFFLEQIDQDKIIYESSVCFYSLRYMILKIMNLHDFERLHYNTLLFNFFYTLTQFMKFIVLDGIEGDRQLKIYGDVGWKNLFPDQYGGYLKPEEINLLFDSNSHLFLLLNWQQYWLNASGPVYDAISRRTPFLTYPAIVHTKDLTGLKSIEYHNTKDLNKKINAVNQIIQQPELNESTDFLVGLYNESMTDMADSLMRDKPLEKHHGEFGAQRCRHEDLLDTTVKNYINEKEFFLRELFEALFKHSITFNIEQSRYGHTSYVQRLLRN
jgi:hypothetical protein